MWRVNIVMENTILIKKLEPVTKKTPIYNKLYTTQEGLYQCHCGKLFMYDIKKADKRKNLSCGCRRHSPKTSIKKYRRKGTEGLSHTLTYKSWVAMIARCTYKKDIGYHRYGGRGITVCDRWLESIQNFIEDMGERPGKEYSIDRIDNNGDYWIGNCKWSTKNEQDRNRRTNKIIEYKGKAKTIVEWSEILEMNQNVLGSRLQKGWSVEKALNTPVKIRCRI